MPLITIAYCCVLAGMLAGLAGHVTASLAIAAAGVAIAILARHALFGASTALFAAGVLAGAGSRETDARCIAIAASRAQWDVVFSTDAHARKISRGKWTTGGCRIGVVAAITRGAAPAGARARITGTAVRGRDGLVVRNAVVTWKDDGPRLLRWRARIGHRIDALFGPDAPMARALLIAEPGAIPAAVRDRYADAGLVHLLSVSGLHVAILAGAVHLLLGMLRVPRDVALVSGTVLTAFYILLIGAPPAAVRSGGMLAALAVGRLLQRPTSPWALLSLGALFPLVDARVAGDLGYQLSVAGMTAVVCAGAAARRLPREWTGWQRKLASELMTALLAAAMTGPLVAAAFGRLSLISPLANLVAAPLVAVAQPALFLAIALAPADALAGLVADGARIPLALLDQVATIASRVPYAAVPVAPRSVVCWSLVLASASAAAAFATRAVWRSLAVGAACLAAAAWWPQQGSGQTELHMLDVGQGDAIAVRSAKGRWIVFDAGRSWDGGDAGRRTVAPYIRRRGGDVEALVITHPHMDHAGGAISVMRELHPRAVWEPGFVSAAAMYRESLQAAALLHVPWRHAVYGGGFTVDDLTVTFVAPDSAWLETVTDPNDASAVAIVTAGNVRFLLTGDAEAAAEQRMLARGDRLRADILKAGHHGSTTSSTPEFLDAVQPRLALMSVGALNRYGHPGPGVLGAFARRGTPVLRTDLHGTIVIRTNGTRITVETEDESWELPPARLPH